MQSSSLARRSLVELGRPDPLGAQLLEPHSQTARGLSAQILILIAAARHREFRQARLTELEVKAAAPRNLHRILERLGQILEHFRHLGGTSQVLLLAVAAWAARIREEAPAVNTDACFVRLKILAPQEPHIVGCDHRSIEQCAEAQYRLQVLLFVGAAGPRHFEIEAIRKQIEPGAQRRLGFRVTPSRERAADVAVAAA